MLGVIIDDVSGVFFVSTMVDRQWKLFLKDRKFGILDWQWTETTAGHLFINAASVSFASMNGYVRERPHVFANKSSIWILYGISCKSTGR